MASSHKQKAMDAFPQRRSCLWRSASSKKADPDYIPHVNMGYQKASVLFSPEAKKDRYTRAVRREGEKNLNMIKKADEKRRECAASALLELYEPQAIVADTNDGTLEKENFTRSDIHDHCLRKITLLKRENRQLLDEVETLQHELRDAKEKTGVRFCDSFLSAHNKDTRTSFFTGIPNYATFLWVW
ncbi:uncharacterized protein LOC121373049 [Gigantopelta aegis]|uniref:uncharacterized protein LOC121373049 n=1 Tax=Gigantopelta aegis TaxID=1735272 RepID=UPI001B88A497|nr:uncharacterized protein LOC121373049 [Gigantopelta aegis]